MLAFLWRLEAAPDKASWNQGIRSMPGTFCYRWWNNETATWRMSRIDFSS